MARSLRDKYAQKNKGKVSIAGRGTVNRTSSTAAGKKYTVNQKNKVKEDTKNYFTFRNSDGSFKNGVKAKESNESRQKIQSGSNKGKYWTDVAGTSKKVGQKTDYSKANQTNNFQDSLAPTALYTAQKEQEKRNNKLQSQIELNTNNISNKYKQTLDNLNEEQKNFTAQSKNDREEALNQLHSAQYLGSLAEQNPEMNGAQEAAQLADERLKTSQVKASSSEAAQDKVKEVQSRKQQVNIAKKAEIDKSNQEIYEKEAQSGDIIEKAKQGAQVADTLNTFEDEEAQKYMTAEERRNYNALKATSEGTAHGYYKSLQDELFDRQAQAQYEKDILTDELVANNIAQMDDSPIKDIVQFAYDKGRELQRGGTTAVSALRRWGKDVSNLPAALTGSEDVLYETAIEKYHQYQRADMEGLEAVVNDVLDSVVYQLPNMGMAAASGGASLAVNTGMVFATSFSSSYTQALEEGYDTDTAQSYAFAQGLSESCTSFLLKGVSLGGKGLIPRIFENKTAGSSLSSMIKHFLGDMGSEGVEEALQEVISTIAGNNILGKSDDINWQNVAYAGVLGSLSAGIMNGAQLSTNPLVREAQLKVRGEKAAEMNTESARLYRENIDSVMEEAKKRLPENSKNLKALEDLNRDIQRGKDVADERINEVCDSALKEARDTAVKDSVDDTVSELEGLAQNETAQEQAANTENTTTEQSTEPQNEDVTPQEEQNPTTDELETDYLERLYELDDVTNEIESTQDLINRTRSKNKLKTLNERLQELNNRQVELQNTLTENESGIESSKTRDDIDWLEGRRQALEEYRREIQGRGNNRALYKSIDNQISEIDSRLEQLQAKSKAENNEVVAENANTTQTENVAQSQQSENLTQGNENYKERAVSERAKKRAEGAGENGRHLTGGDLDEYLDTGKNNSVIKKKKANFEKEGSPILSSFRAVKDYISQVLKKSNTDNMTNKAYGIVSNKIADMIYDADNRLSTYGYYLEITPSDIKHSDIEHATAKRAGNRDMSVSEMTDIIYNLNDYATEVIDVKTKKDGRISAVLGLNTDDGFATVTVTISNNKLSISPKNVIGHTKESYDSFKNDKKKKSKLPQTLTDSDISTDVAPQPTKERGVLRTSNQNIAQPTSNVKGERTSNIAENKKIQGDEDLTFANDTEKDEFIKKSGISKTKFNNFVKFVKQVFDHSSKRSRFVIGKANGEEVAAFKKIGVDIEGKEHSIRANDLKHIDNSHGAGSIKGDDINPYIVTKGDLEAIPYIINNADNVYYRKFTDKKGNEKTGVLYEKIDVDTTYYVETLDNDKFLDGVQMIKSKKGTIPDTYKNDIKRGSVYSRITDVTSPTANTENSANSAATPGAYVQNETRQLPNQNIAQPTSNVKGERTSNVAEHAKNARFMTVEGMQKIQELIDSGALDYEVYTDKKAVTQAERSIAQNGIDVVASAFSKKVVNGEQITKTDVAEAQKAFETYIKDGQVDKAMNLLFDMRASATNAGQVAQAFSLIDYATPAGRVQLAEKIMNRLQQGIEQRYKKSGVKLSLNEDLLTKLANAETTEEMELAQTALMADLTEQLPISFQDRVTAWRYFAMLSNPKTHIRNIIGNVAFVPMIETKNGIGALLEKTIPKDQRTKAVLTPKDKALRDFATEQFEANKDTLSQSNRNDDTQDLWNNRKIFGDNKFESFRSSVMGLLEIEDMIFKKRAYISSYAQAMKARGYTAETITDKAKAEIHGYAAQEALKATYQDASQLARALNRISKQSGIKRFIIEGLVPFKKTPINILKRGIEYSPIGLVRGIYDMATKVKNGEMSATQGIDSISSGLTGVGAMALGAFLMSMGFIEIGSDDENEEAMNKLTGGQSYALRIGDRTYTIDWMVPTAMPLLTGAYVQRAFEKGFDVTDLSGCLNAITKMSEPLMETSMLQGLSNAIKYASYGDTDSALVNVAIGAVESYGGQFVPSIANMFARITDDTQRAYYHDKTTGVPDFAQTIFYNAANKIPGVSMLLNPKVDRWGREIHTDTTERVLEATVSPGYYSKDNITDVDNEINRLYSQIGDGGVIPPAPSKYMTVNGERKDFSSEEYVKYQKSLGSNAYSGVENLIKTEAYKGMTDKEKAAAVKIVYDYAKQNAYNEISGNYERDKWVTVVQDKDIDIGAYAGYKTRAKELDDNEELTATEKKKRKIGLIQGMDDKYKTDMYALEFEDSDTDKVKTIGYATGTMKVPANTFMQYFADGVNNYSADKDEDGKSISGTKKAKVLAYIANMDITDEQKIYFATKIAGYTKIEDVSEINAYASGKGSSGSNGKSSKGRSGRSRSSGSGKSSKPDFSPLLSIAKKSSSSKTSSPIGNLDFNYSAKLFAKDHDTIVKDTKARELEQIDNNPVYTSAMKNKLKQEIERRYK